MQQLLKFDRRDIGRWLLAVVCGGWLIGATWHVATTRQAYIPVDGANSYMPYERQLAACNERRGSQAKYDCVSELMLWRDRNLFQQILIVILPPLGLAGLIGGIAMAVRLRRERERERLAREAYAAQMEAYRAKLAAEEAEIAAGVRKEEMFLDDDGNLVEPPSRFARWKDEAEAQ
ncbi:MAG: hypothetical protein ACK4NA_03575 [Alphaproteobacteria bacterium]